MNVMTAGALITKAEECCRHADTRLPTELRQMARQWQRERFDLEFCWRQVQPLLSAGRPIWQAELDVRKHHAALQAEKESRDRRLNMPPRSNSLDEQRKPHQRVRAREHGPIRGANRPRRSSIVGLGKRSPATQAEPKRKAGPSAAKSVATKTEKIRELLTTYVVDNGPVRAAMLERIAQEKGLLLGGQKMSTCTAFRRIAKELNIESLRSNFGASSYYRIWRLKPPSRRHGDRPGRHGRRMDQ
jgi:hypothetical protein